jgi:hypothetical protein
MRPPGSGPPRAREVGTTPRIRRRRPRLPFQRQDSPSSRGSPGRRSVMTILQKPPHSGDRHAGKRWYKFGHDEQAVRHTDAWEHETFAEEQARWEEGVAQGGHGGGALSPFDNRRPSQGPDFRRLPAISSDGVREIGRLALSNARIGDLVRPLRTGLPNLAASWPKRSAQRLSICDNASSLRDTSERSDPEYARICEAVRQARQTGGEVSQRADEAKAEWDARVATQRQANDDAQRAQHALKPG